MTEDQAKKIAAIVTLGLEGTEDQTKIGSFFVGLTLGLDHPELVKQLRVAFELTVPDLLLAQISYKDNLAEVLQELITTITTKEN